MLLFLDTETTGLPKYSATNDPVEKWPRVVQLAWSYTTARGCVKAGTVSSFTWTDFSIPADSGRFLKKIIPKKITSASE